MSKLLGNQLVRLMVGLKKSLGRRHKELITASSVAVCVLLLRSVGLLQSLEWAAFDQFFNLRSYEPPEERITIIAIDEASLRQVGSWPIPDGVVAEVLKKIQVHNPRAIGLDIYRDLPVQPGNKETACSL